MVDNILIKEVRSLNKLVQQSFDALSVSEKEGVLRKIFPGFSDNFVNEISQISFNNLPEKHIETGKNIRSGLVAAFTKECFSPKQEKKLNNPE
jgi:predicted glycoside hydrolase/deacetylase ChbG (UPF0249 family)